MALPNKGPFDRGNPESLLNSQRARGEPVEPHRYTVVVKPLKDTSEPLWFLREEVGTGESMCPWSALMVSLGLLEVEGHSSQKPGGHVAKSIDS
ncbi:MAG: hypothetical protein H6Q51_435 [Deltaproteobacteria bacterium]|jgi:hypothetical protein|nr:hypothetical protein [Deltaproteobacteria bacterium]